jgi:hypothetical protein
VRTDINVFAHPLQNIGLQPPYQSIHAYYAPAHYTPLQENERLAAYKKKVSKAFAAHELATSRPSVSLNVSAANRQDLHVECNVVTGLLAYIVYVHQEHTCAA